MCAKKTNEPAIQSVPPARYDDEGNPLCEDSLLLKVISSLNLLQRILAQVCVSIMMPFL